MEVWIEDTFGLTLDSMESWYGNTCSNITHWGLPSFLFPLVALAAFTLSLLTYATHIFGARRYETKKAGRDSARNVLSKAEREGNVASFKDTDMESSMEKRLGQSVDEGPDIEDACVIM